MPLNTDLESENIGTVPSSATDPNAALSRALEGLTPLPSQALSLDACQTIWDRTTPHTNLAGGNRTPPGDCN